MFLSVRHYHGFRHYGRRRPQKAPRPKRRRGLPLPVRIVLIPALITLVLIGLMLWIGFKLLLFTLRSIYRSL